MVCSTDESSYYEPHGGALGPLVAWRFVPAGRRATSPVECPCAYEAQGRLGIATRTRGRQTDAMECAGRAPPSGAATALWLSHGRAV